MITIHYFHDSGEAYDASQCDDEIKDGDVLVGLDDRVVGFLFKAWPISVTENIGKFHQLAAGTKYSDLQSNALPSSRPSVDYEKSADGAQRELERLERDGWSRPDTRPFTAAIYLVDRIYGGPEEGGWWYDSGVPSDDHCDLTRGFKDEDEANAYARNLNETMQGSWNEGRPPLSSIISDGEYRAMVFRGNPTTWPTVPPHYE